MSLPSLPDDDDLIPPPIPKRPSIRNIQWTAPTDHMPVPPQTDSPAQPVPAPTYQVLVPPPPIQDDDVTGFGDDVAEDDEPDDFNGFSRVLTLNRGYGKNKVIYEEDGGFNA